MKNKKMYCGIDIHYKKSYFCFINEKGEEKKLVEIPTQKKEIHSIINEFKDYPIQYAFEAGGMSNYISYALKELNNTDKIHIVHPLKFKIITESSFKNDKVDSQKLAK
ncbi:MAG: transposase, partial [Candidatus Margulisbacteria bacterium]|nr:transposase [Candidatus Margulisiibacteriota bacterium]